MDGKNTRSSRSGRKSAGRSSVVGSKLTDVSAKSSGRRLPRGGIREQDGLKVAEGAIPDSSARDSSLRLDRTRKVLRIVVVVIAVVLVALITVAIVLSVLSNTSAFQISKIETFDSEHVSADEVLRLSNVAEGSTLLNMDEEAIQNGVRKNPWVSSVDIERVFPDTLRLHVNERKLGAVVAMSSGGVAWLLGDDNAWIEPLKLEVSQSESTNDAALAKADSMGVVLISDVPGDVAPVAGAECTDAAIQAVMLFTSQLSDSFKQQIVCYSASSQDDISCTLKNGVEVSFGSANDVGTKESVASHILEQFGGQIVYINVRIPSRPTYRRVDSEYVREGTGATGTSVDEQSIVPKIRGVEEQEGEDSSDGQTDGNSSNSENTSGSNDAASGTQSGNSTTNGNKKDSSSSASNGGEYGSGGSANANGGYDTYSGYDSTYGSGYGYDYDYGYGYEDVY